MNLRRFNPQGIERFRDFLQECRQAPDLQPPEELLAHPELTEVVQPEIPVSIEYFENRGDAARYLYRILKPLNPADVQRDAGLWTWLSLLFFDSVCPVKDGQRVVRSNYCYIYEPDNMRHFYRHLLSIGWRVLQLAPNHNRLFLKTRLASRDRFTEEVFQRLYVTRIPAMFEVLDRLYWDPIKKRVRAGMTSSKEHAGDLTHRLPLRIRQLEKTYDLMSLSADQLIELLGEEFSFASRELLLPL